VFWDELFVFPLLTLRFPDLTRSLLLYRWRRLDAARDAARAIGLSGALFPWQSGSDGREETPQLLFNPRSGRWMPDHSRLQRHVGLAVAYNVWRYFEATGDIEFLAGYGADLVVEVARLFAALTSYDPGADRYDIAGVMGPDEYHDAYPGATSPSLRNNAYTNALAAWVLGRAIEVLALVDRHRCGACWSPPGFEPDEVARWDHISRRLRVPFHDGVISQFDGYETLDELDWAGYRSRYGNIGRLDLILEAEGDTTNRYKLAKQADVLMLFYLLSPAELGILFERLGYRLDAEIVERTIDYYQARTAHGSTLSRVVHSWVLAQADRPRSWSLFEDALMADLDYTQGGTTGEGIHLGAMAGSVDLLVRCYAGLATHDETLWFDPNPPAELRALRFDVRYRGQHISAALTGPRLRLHVHPCASAPVRIGIGAETRLVAGGDVWEHVIAHP
jgi:trehalose/maltose hydrolase-like predicted phosphorylase